MTQQHINHCSPYVDSVAISPNNAAISPCETERSHFGNTIINKADRFSDRGVRKTSCLLVASIVMVQEV